MKKEIVALLKSLLKQAEAGEIKGLAVITIEPEDGIGQSIVGNIKDEKFKALGALEVLKRDLLDGVERMKTHEPEVFNENVAGESDAS